MGEIGSMPGYSQPYCQVFSQEHHTGSFLPYNNPVRYDGEGVVTVYQPSPPEMSSTEWDASAYPYQEQNLPCILVIEEEPISKIRFRYQSEKGSHGSMSGRNSTNTQKSWPTVKLMNHHLNEINGVKIRASLFTEDQTKPHVHRLLGKSCNPDTGDCVLPLQQDLRCSFPNLGVLFTEKKRVPDVLFSRKKSELGANLTEEQYRQLQDEAKQEAKNMKMNTIRICFQAFNSSDEQISPAVFSEPVHNLKSPDSGELKITRLSRCSSSCDGNDEVFLLCEKVNKKDIKVRFFELGEDGNERWSDFGKFSDSDVHHQVAIVFRTPPYHDTNIDTPVKVFVQLFRQNDGETSDSLDFHYKPKEKDPDQINSKKRRLNEPDNDFKGFGGHQDFAGQNQFGPSGPEHGHWRDGSGNSGQSDYPMMPPHGHSYTQNNQMANFLQQFAKDLQMSSSSNDSQSSSQDSSTSYQMSRDPTLASAMSISVGAERTQQALDPSVSPISYVQEENSFSLPDLGLVETDGSASYVIGQRRICLPQVKFQSKGIEFQMARPEEHPAGKMAILEEKPVGQMASEVVLFDGKEDLSEKMKGLNLSAPVQESQGPKKEAASPRKLSKEKNQLSSRRPGSKDSKGDLSPNRNKNRIDVRRKSEPSKLDLKVEQMELGSRQSVEFANKLAIENFVKRQMIPRFGCSLRLFTSTGKIQSLLWSMAPFLPSQNRDGDNALHLAVIHQPLNKTLFEQLMPVVRSLMPYDVINHTNNIYQTPLHLAVAVQNVTIINWLLICGADPNLQDSRGNTPIHMAVLKRDSSCLAVLLEESHYKTRSTGKPIPNCNILNFDGYSAMHLAVSMESKPCLSLLMDTEALVNVQDGTGGRTPLHLAVQMQSPLVEDLLNHPRVDVDARDYAGNTPLHLACSLELLDMAHALMMAGADPSAENFVVQRQISDKENEMVEDENKNGAEDEEFHGRTPLDIATESENEEMLSILNGTLTEENREKINGQRVRQMFQVPQPEPVNFPTMGGLSLKDKWEVENPRIDSGYGDSKGSLFDSEEQESLVSKLCQLLDPPCTLWENLASVVFEDPSMVNSLRKLEDSPTLTLYKKIKENGHKLKDTLDAAALSDVYLQLPEPLLKALDA